MPAHHVPLYQRLCENIECLKFWWRDESDFTLIKCYVNNGTDHKVNGSKAAMLPANERLLIKYVFY